MSADAGQRFLEAWWARDWDAFRDLLTPDCVWSMPGSGRLSGDAQGRDAVTDRARFITAGGLDTEHIHTLTGAAGVALILRNTAEVDGRRLDEHLATVITTAGDQIARIDTFLSDVPGKDAFFV